MSSKFRAVLSCTLLCLVFSSSQSSSKISEMERRLNQPDEKWAAVQEKAKSLGLHTSLNDYVAANPAAKPRLFLDFPFGKKLVAENLKRTADDAEYKSLAEVYLPDSTFDHAAGVALLQENLKEKLPEEATATEVYKALLKQLAPENTRLDQFKECVEKSNSLGHIFSRDCDSFVAVYPIKELANQLLLRGISKAGLGSRDYSDIEAVGRLVKLCEYGESGVLSHIISSVFQLYYQSTLGFLTRQDNADIETLQKLIIKAQDLDSHAALTHALKYEYALQCEWITAIIENNPYPDSPLVEKPLSEIMASFTELQKLSARHQLASYSISSFFEISQPPLSAHKTTSWVSTETRLKNHKGAPTSREVIQATFEGLDLYFEGSAELSLTLDLQNLANACRLYYIEHSAFPDSLDLLVPSYLATPIKNSYSGGAYTLLPASEDEPFPTIRGTMNLPTKGAISHELQLIE